MNVIGVGMPGWIKLNQFGFLLREAFPGETPYLVGTAAQGKEWRDVDVRIMLGARAWNRLVGKDEKVCRGVYYGGRAGAFALAFSTLGQEMTGLPIDFQLQKQGWANKVYATGPRHALGVRL